LSLYFYKGVYVFILKNLCFILVAFISLSICYAQGPSASDFIPPEYVSVIEGGTKEIKEKEKISKVDGAVKANSAQDAINHFVEANKSDKNSLGEATIVQFPSGIGFVATGKAAYNKQKNNTATRISRRNAYVKAYTTAKVNLFKKLNGLDNNSKTQIGEIIKNETDSNGNKTQYTGTINEEIEHRVEGMLGGFVIHEIDDDEVNSFITVSIVSFPKKFKIRRISPSITEASNLQIGIDQVLTEVKKSIVPPIGGRVVIVPNSTDRAFIGFGSDVVVESNVPQLQLLNFNNSQKISISRADDSLASVLKADKINWTSKITSTTKESVNDFNNSDAGDPLAENNNQDNANRIQKALGEFNSNKNTDESYLILNKSRIPPGIIHKVWNTSDKGTVIAVSVWIPHLGKIASEIGKERSKPLLEDDTLDSLVSPKTGKSKLNPDGNVKPLQSGKLKNDL
jgi:hypothetical protein